MRAYVIALALALGGPETAEQKNEATISDAQRRLEELRARIELGKERLKRIGEESIGLRAGSAPVTIAVADEMGPFFSLSSATVALDGAVISDGFSGALLSGPHLVSAKLVYRGNGRGLFPYLDGYTLTLKSSYVFDVQAGKPAKLTITGFEQGGPTRNLLERPALKFEIR